ncbi:MAG: hypothetical protein IT406_03290 [Candidatus Yanofskybacteria bacterium]|nr:hypothetical protein [Candidatus Yanofskybacteria bacterium]
MRCLIDVVGERTEGEYWQALDQVARMWASANVLRAIGVSSASDTVLLVASEGERLLRWDDDLRGIILYIWEHRSELPASTGRAHEDDVRIAADCVQRRIESIRHELIARSFVRVSREELLRTPQFSLSFLLSLLGQENLERVTDLANSVLPEVRRLAREMGGDTGRAN